MVQIPNHALRQLTLYGILLFLFIFLFIQLYSFVPSLLGAMTLYILLRSPMRFLTERWGWKRGSSAVFLLFVSFVVIMLPVSFCGNILYTKIGDAIANANQFTSALKKILSQTEKHYHITFISNAKIALAGQSITDMIPKLLGATFNSLVIVIILYFILYFMLANTYSLEDWLSKHIPLKKENVDLLGNDLNRLVLSNAIGLPITAVIQGILGVVAYYFLGIDDLLFWFMVTCITAVIPMVGSAVAFTAVAILLSAQGQTAKCFIMLAYGFGIMNVLDSVFRIAIQKKIGNIHPLVTTFGVIVGINLFGFIGLIFGPILISFFILLVNIYINEFSVE